jgi:polyhydroxyalkanoate synthase subunit PhaC
VSFFDNIATYRVDGALRTLDWMRRGFGSEVADPPTVTPYRVIYEGGKVSLRHYSAVGSPRSVPILLVYALIKRPFILDLQPGISVIENLTRQGFEVFLIDWLPPTTADSWRGFEAYVSQDLANAVRAVQLHRGVGQLTLFGYCLGALLSLVYTAIRPNNVKNLVMLALPLDLSVGELPVYHLLDSIDERMLELVTTVYGNCPAWLIRAFFYAMAPMHHLLDKYVGLYRNQEREGYARMFELFERWMNSDVPLAGQLFRELGRDVLKRNRLIEGSFAIGGETVDLTRITCPLLNVVAEFDDVVHPKSSLPLTTRAASFDTTTLTFPTGHIGAVVSGAAHKKLWPQIGSWLKQHDS